MESQYAVYKGILTFSLNFVFKPWIVVIISPSLVCIFPDIAQVVFILSSLGHELLVLLVLCQIQTQLVTKEYKRGKISCV